MSIKMSRERRGPLALELWAKQLIDSYSGVTIRNMTTSWRNGLAFCALIHRFRPDLIDYDKLDPSDIIGNCALAFDTAESKLGIPALLDPEDMAAHEVPDRLSVLTYVAQFYNTFKNSEVKARVSPQDDEEDNDGLKNRSGDKSKSSSPEKVVAKRKKEVNEDEIMDRVRRDMPKRSIMLSTSNMCSECKNPVFISERVLFMKKLYHRICFRCCNCENPLNPHIADVAPDGSLFCVEKACHLELQKRFQLESSIINLSVPDKDNIQKQNNSVVKLSEIPSEISHLNSQSTTVLVTPISEVSENKENCQIDEHERQNLSRFSVGRVSAMKAQFDSIQGDGPTRQKPLEKCPSPTIHKNTKLMDFAGALLHVNEDKKPNNCTDIKVSDEVTKSEQKHEFSEDSPCCANFSEGHQQHDEKTLVCSEHTFKIKSATEVTSIREKAILTVADQLKKFSEPLQMIQNKISEEVDPIIELQTEQSSEKVEDNSENIQKGNFDVPVLTSEISDSHVVIRLDKSEIKMTEQKETAEIDTENTVGQNNDVLETPSKDYNKEEEIDKLITTPISVTPSPLPRKRVTTSCPSPGISPSPSPIPRTRNASNKIKNPELKSTNELWKKQDYYPTELNPFESEEDVSSCVPDTIIAQVKPSEEPKNPFEEEEEEEKNKESPPVPPSPKPRSSTPNSRIHEVNNNGTAKVKDFRSSAISSNIAANFNVPPPRPPPPSPRKNLHPKPYNPFEDDNDIGEYEDDTSGNSKGFDDTTSISSKMSDLSGISSVPTPTYRSHNTSDAEGHGSTKLRSRKSRRAPLPPAMMQVSVDSAPKLPVIKHQSPNEEKNDDSKTTSVEPSISSPEKKIIPVSPKLLKELKNPHTSSSYRKKRRAPPPRRRVEPLPEATIKMEFADLDIRQKELERQGITLESTIRSMMEEENQENEMVADNNQNAQLDEMMVQLWGIVNEKNEILRRQTELEYLRRGHRLEEMQAEVDFKLRVLMETPEDQKLPNQADLEQLYEQQLIKLVDERNEVVEWLDYHRQLDREEDLMLSKSISQFSNSKAAEPIPDTKLKTKSKKTDKKAESKVKSKDDNPKDKKKDGKLKSIFSKKRNKKSKSEEDKHEN